MRKALDEKDDRIDLSIKTGLGIVGIGFKIGLTGAWACRRFVSRVLVVLMQVDGKPLPLVRCFSIISSRYHFKRLGWVSSRSHQVKVR